MRNERKLSNAKKKWKRKGRKRKGRESRKGMWGAGEGEIRKHK